MTTGRRCTALLAALLSSSATASAAITESVFQVADLGADPPAPAVPSVRVNSVFVDGNRFYFAGARRDTGDELWRSDGTAAGTELIMDINPGMTGSGIAALTRVGDVVLFFADDGTHGYELWRTDGTSAGTTLVRDVCPGACDGTGGRYYDPQRSRLLAAVGEVAYFPGNDGVHGTELWRSDGSAAGTAMVADLAPGEQGAGADQLTPVGGGLFFAAGVHGLARLWRSDGTEAGTVQVSDVGPTEQWLGIGPRGLTAFGELLLFVVDDGTHGVELWRSDGSPAGTGMLADICPGACSGMPGDAMPLPVWRGQAYFPASSPQAGTELWASDGTPAGTRLVVDRNPGPDAGVAEIAPTPEALYLVADDGVHGKELWIGDGTVAGTHMIHDFWPGKLGAGGSSFVAAGDLLYFASYGGLWRSDGTLRGTGLIFSSIREWWMPTLDLPIAALDRRLLFLGADETGSGLFLTDGTWAGTTPVAVVELSEVPVPGSFPRYLRPTLGGLTFFPTRATEPLWHTRGQPGTTVPVATGPYAVRDGELATSGASIFFLGVGGLWRTSLSTQEPLLVHTRLYSSERMWDLTTVGEKVFFVDEPDQGDGKEIAVVNQDGGGATIVKDICASECYGTAPAGLTAFGDRLLFTANTHGIYGGGVWLSDGTEAGTVEVAPLGGQSYSQYDDYALVASGPLLYFAGTRPESGQELWVSDGTPGAATMLRDICPGACDGLPPASVWGDTGTWRIVAASTGRVYFIANDELHGKELWVSDGTAATTRMVADLTPGGGGSTITWMTAAGADLYFAFDDGEHGRELWFSDGTEEGTRLVEDINAGAVSSNPAHLAWTGEVLLFAASDGLHGLEPWRSDGTWWGTRQIADIVPGPGSSSPEDLTQAGPYVYFRAYHLETGFELWAATVDADTRLRRRLARR